MPVNIEHAKMVQVIVERMARNSFLLKGWNVTLVAALVGVAATEHEPRLALVGAGAVAVLGLLDAYYLALERRYRDLYDAVVASSAGEWTLSVQPISLGDALRALASPSVAFLHGSCFAAALGVALAIA